MLLTILFCFTSCQKDEIDTWVSLEADKTTVAVNETVSFTMSGNAETYVVYTGDAGHDFTKSYLVVTGGKKVDQEAYVLTQAKLDLWIPILTTEIAAYNIASPTSPLNANAIIAGLASLVDKSYYKDTAAIKIRELMPTLPTPLPPTPPNQPTPPTFNKYQNLVDTYFTNLSVLLTPAGGFSTGVAINRYYLTYSYKFANPGTYVVTLLGTRLSDKNYSGSGYIYNSTSSASGYNYKRNTDTVTIVVE